MARGKAGANSRYKQAMRKNSEMPDSITKGLVTVRSFAFQAERIPTINSL